MAEIHGWATQGPKQKLELFSFNPGPLNPEEVEIAIEYCGLCHSDLSDAPEVTPPIDQE